MNIRFPTESITDTSFVVQWDAVTNDSAHGYIVNWTDGANPIQTVTVIETSYIVTGLTPNTTYTVNVAAVNKCGTGVSSVDDRVTTSASFSVNTVSTTSIATTTTTTTTIGASTSATTVMPIFNATNSAACVTTSKFFMYQHYT